MIVNFWQQLKKPIFCLAPMEEVTDFAFREMFARYSNHKATGTRQQAEGGNGFVLFTEFVNVDGLLHPEGRKKLEIDLKYSEAQRPIVAQIWGSNPEKFEQAARIVAELGFDGVDINMGCPQSKEIQVGACAALIREPKLAQEIIQATKEGWIKGKTSDTSSVSLCETSSPSASAQAMADRQGEEEKEKISPSSPFRRGEGGEVAMIPVSVKTRIGYSKPDEMENWIKNILDMEPAALTLHGRTKKEMSKVPAHWDKIAEAVEIRNKLQVTSDKSQKTIIIGNGDVQSYEDGLSKIKETGVDGVMIGRGAFGNPWIFRADNHQQSIKERFDTMLEHAELFEKTFKGQKPFMIMRKHFKAYCSGFSGAAELRAKLMETKNLAETRSIVNKYIHNS